MCLPLLISSYVCEIAVIEIFFFMFDKLKVYNAKYKLFLAEKPGSNQVHFRQYV